MSRKTIEFCAMNNVPPRFRLSPSHHSEALLEIVYTEAAPAFVYICVFNINAVHTAVEKINVSSILLKFAVTFM